MAGAGSKGTAGDTGIHAAKELVQEIARVPQAFVTTLRAITKAKQLNKGKNVTALKVITVETLLPFVERSPSFRAVLYFGAQRLHAHKLPGKNFTPQTLLELFDVSELIAIYVLLLLHKRIKRACDKEAWPELFDAMKLHMEIGILVGRSISALNGGDGLLIGGMRYLGLACFLAKDPVWFAKYWQSTKEKGRLFDVQAEEERWQCNHLEVAAMLLLKLNAGLPYVEGFIIALQSVEPEDDDLKKWYVLIRLTESLHQEAMPYKAFDIDAWFPDRAIWVKCKSSAQELIKNPPAESWITKTARDLDAETKAILGI